MDYRQARSIRLLLLHFRVLPSLRRNPFVVPCGKPEYLFLAASEGDCGAADAALKWGFVVPCIITLVAITARILNVSTVAVVDDGAQQHERDQ